MPLLHPLGKNAPQGWRHAADAFRELQAWGMRAKEPVNRWQLSHPTRAESWRGIQWRLLYTTNKREWNVYVGYDAMSAADGIRRIIPEMKELARKRGALLATEMEILDADIAAGRRKHPIYTPGFSERLRETWLKGTRDIRTREELERFKREHKHLMELLNMKAGVLDMTMLAYLTKCPDSKRWPNPPETEEELRKRRGGR